MLIMRELYGVAKLRALMRHARAGVQRIAEDQSRQNSVDQTARSGAGNWQFQFFRQPLFSRGSRQGQSLPQASIRVVKMEDYAAQRAQLLSKERELNALPQLSAEEVQADTVLEALKTNFAGRFQMHELLQFYGAVDALRETQLYRVLLKMPKGAHLHVHTTGSVHPDFLRNEILTNPKVYFSPTEGKFSVKHREGDGFEPAGAYFASSPERAQEFSNLLSLNPVTGTGTSNQVWKHFLHLFLSQGNVTNYESIFERYMTESFRSMREENIQRVEYKHLTKLLFSDTGALSLEEEAVLLQRITQQFQQQYPDFSAGYVVLGFKAVPPEKLQEEMLEIIQVAKKYPKVLLGYDLVGEEETLKQLVEYGHILSEMKKVAVAEGHKLNYFFHAGETVNPRSENLADALALGTLRIGHGINLSNHPALLDEVKSRGVLVECCPLSNMLLRYVLDPRTHPAQGFLRRGVRVSISSDDPGMFGYKGVTEDFVYATVMWNLGLAELKKLVLNSIEGCTEPEETMRHWQPKWTEFVHYLGQLQVE